MFFFFFVTPFSHPLTVTHAAIFGKTVFLVVSSLSPAGFR